MRLNVAQVVRDRLGLDLSDLRGANVSGEIPIATDGINRVLAEHAAAGTLPVASLRVETGDSGALTATIVPKARLLPALRLSLAITRQPAFPADPVLHLRWSMPGLGRLARLASPALSFLGALPHGVAVAGDRATIDLLELLRSRGLDELAGYIEFLECDTRVGAVVVRFRLGVPRAQTADA